MSKYAIIPTARDSWYIEARPGSENHRGDCVRFLLQQKRDDAAQCYFNMRAEDVVQALIEKVQELESQLASLEGPAL